MWRHGVTCVQFKTMYVKGVAGYEEAVAGLKKDGHKDRVFVWFSAEEDASGSSWCPDCTKGVSL